MPRRLRILITRMKSAFRERHRQWRDAWIADFDKPGNRRRAHWDMMAFDHGFLRLWWRNIDEFAPGVWRSNQPSPAQIAALGRRGVRTIVNLRGASDWGSYHLERAACEQAGIRLVDSRLYSRMPPAVEEVQSLFDVFDSAERPLLMHCKSGADRAGLGAALYLLWAGHTPQEAARQLSLRYLHVRHAKTGVLDRFIATYARAHRETGITFTEWLRTDYDKQAIMAEHQSSGLANLFIDRVLRRE